MNNHENIDRICADQIEGTGKGYVIIGGFVAMVVMIFVYAVQPAKEVLYPQSQPQIVVHTTQGARS